MKVYDTVDETVWVFGHHQTLHWFCWVLQKIQNITRPLNVSHIRFLCLRSKQHAHGYIISDISLPYVHCQIAICTGCKQDGNNNSCWGISLVCGKGLGDGVFILKGSSGEVAGLCITHGQTLNTCLPPSYLKSPIKKSTFAPLHAVYPLLICNSTYIVTEMWCFIATYWRSIPSYYTFLGAVFMPFVR